MVGCVFLSILVHEYGHGLMAKAFRFSPSIVLHGLGGLCFSEAERQTLRQRLAVLICGPGAGFVLFGLAILAAWAIRGIPPATRWHSSGSARAPGTRVHRARRVG